MNFIEKLEGRELLAAVPANINLSQLRQNHAEGAIAIDPTNEKRMFVVSNIERGDGLLTMRSSNGGKTWAKRVISNGRGRERLVPACCDGSASWDEFGNLFVAYMNSDTDQVNIIHSSDGGRKFRQLVNFSGELDQPTVMAAEGMVWATFEMEDNVGVAGASVSGLGSIGTWTEPQKLEGPEDGNFGDIAIGPDGQVMVTYQAPANDRGPSEIYVHVDPDGMGGADFGPARLATATNVGGFRPIAAQPRASIDGEAGLAYDRSGGEFDGRVYLVYTNAPNTRTDDTDIKVRYSDDDGATWSGEIAVSAPSRNSQFLPRIAVDQTSGRVGFAWYDSRNDNGRGKGSTNRQRNDDAQLWGATARPTEDGPLIRKNFRVSKGTFNARAADNAIDLGDYIGLTYHRGILWPVWADNSNSTGDNPDGRLNELDLYTARVRK